MTQSLEPYQNTLYFGIQSTILYSVHGYMLLTHYTNICLIYSFISEICMSIRCKFLEFYIMMPSQNTSVQQNITNILKPSKIMVQFAPYSPTPISQTSPTGFGQRPNFFFFGILHIAMALNSMLPLKDPQTSKTLVIIYVLIDHFIIRILTYYKEQMHCVVDSPRTIYFPYPKFAK